MPAYETYSIRRGDSLSRIAKAHGTTVDALKALNGIRDEDKILAGAVIRIRQVSEDLPAMDRPAGEPAAVEKPRRHSLGSLSSKYEVSKGGCGTCSHGKGDRGGVSYGSYQLASKLNRPAEFLESEGAPWKARFAGQTQGTPEFSATWKQIAAEAPGPFHEAQHAYIARTHYQVQMDCVKAKTGIDLAQCGPAVQDVVWSTSVQHGPNSDLIAGVVKALPLRPGDPGFERELIKAIYVERGRRDPDGALTHFRRNSKAVQDGVANRFRNEVKDALALLAAERTKDAIAGVAAPLPEGEAAEEELLDKAAKALTDDEVELLLERYGDAEAVNDFMAGRKVAVALRKSTNTRKYRLGAYDDAILLIWREAGGQIRIKRFPGNTEPCGRYAYDGGRKGSSVDINKDGKVDLGRLLPGTYHYQLMSGEFNNARFLKARDIQVCERDTNQDGEFNDKDANRIDSGNAGRTMYIHRGGNDWTWSAGCQTIPDSHYATFLATLGGQSNLSYILINAD